MPPAPSTLETFRQNAARVATTVVDAQGLPEALDYLLNLCERKNFCELLPTGCGEALSPQGAQACALATSKVIAAPGLPAEDFDHLADLGRARGFTVLQGGLHEHLAGIDIAFSLASLGVAETASCLLDAADEEARLAGMIAEIHVIALPKSRIVPALYDAEETLQAMLEKGGAYAALISGSSRTSDIERVLTLGVHGPLELHVILLES